jgi:hypothetical protein
MWMIGIPSALRGALRAGFATEGRLARVRRWGYRVAHNVRYRAIADISIILQIRWMNLRCVLAPGVALIGLGCSSAPENPTLCDLAKSPTSFAGRTVTVAGSLLASKHGSALEDKACDRGIAISWRGERAGLSELNALVRQELELTDNQPARVRVTGQVRRVARSAMLNEPYWEIYLSSAEVLR